MPQRLLLLTLISALLCACGGAPAEEGASLPKNAVEVTTNDGGTLSFEEFDVDCYVREPNAPVVYFESRLQQGADTASLKVRATDGFEGEVPLPHGETVDEVEMVTASFYDEAGESILLSTGADESSGRFEVVSASCAPQPSIEFRIDATLYNLADDGRVGEVQGHVETG